MMSGVLYGVTLLGYAVSDEDSLELINAINNATDLLDLFKALDKMEATVDEEVITIMMETDRQNIIDVLRIIKFGFEGAGELFAEGKTALEDLLEKSRLNPHLFNKMTRDQVKNLMKGTITFDNDFFNITVLPDGVVKLRSAKNFLDLSDKMRHSFDQKRDNLLIISTMSQKLRSRLLAKIDAQHIAEVSSIGNFSGWLHSIFSHNLSAEIFRMVETLVRFLRFTYTIHTTSEQQKGQTYLSAFASWTFKMWTGYGISVLPLIAYLVLTLHFLFKDTIINGIYQEVIRRYSTRGWCLYMKMSVKEMFLIQKTQELDENNEWRITSTRWPLLLHLFLYFTISNVIFITISWILFYGYGSDMLSSNLYVEVENRVNVKNIWEEEILNLSTISSMLIIVITLILEVFFNWIIKLSLLRLERWFFAPKTSHGTATNIRKYDGLITRLHIATYIRLLVRPSELYSWIWKFLGFQIVELLSMKYIGVPLPMDAHMNEVNGMVAWTASVWNVKSLLLKNS